MIVRVEYTAQLKAALGVGEESVEVNDRCSPAQLFGQLAERHGERFRAMVMDENGKKLPWIMLAVGGEAVGFDSPRKLRDGDLVSIMTPMSGG